MALAGTTLGVAASIAITMTMLRVLPCERLGVLLVVAVLAALAASILPTRRAARRPVAESLATE